MGPGELIFSRYPPSTYQQLVAEPAGHAGLQNLGVNKRPRTRISPVEPIAIGAAPTRSNRFGT
jgi:hypothetical protein